MLNIHHLLYLNTSHVFIYHQIKISTPAHDLKHILYFFILLSDYHFINLKKKNYSNSQIKSYHYTLLYRNYSSIWFYMCSTVQSPQAVLNGVIILLSNICYHFLRKFLDIFSNRFYPYFEV